MLDLQKNAQQNLAKRIDSLDWVVYELICLYNLYYKYFVYIM